VLHLNVATALTRLCRVSGTQDQVSTFVEWRRKTRKLSRTGIKAHIIKGYTGDSENGDEHGVASGPALYLPGHGSVERFLVFLLEDIFREQDR
jgi:hypothetical protein